jgi:hypothetical protein
MTKPLIDTHDVIKGALGLIENPKTWTHHALARDRHGHATYAVNRCAMRWCARGALVKTAFDLTNRNEDAASNLASTAIQELETLCGNHLADVNDHEGREAVVKLFKKALAA